MAANLMGAMPLGFNYFEVLIWPGGGFIGLLLWLLSIVMVALVIMVLVNIRRGNLLPLMTSEQIRVMFEQKQYKEAVELTASQPDMLSYAVNAALSAAPRGFSAMERAVEEATNERVGKLLRSIEYLNLLGNVGPMFGLLGTVWGMIMAFFKIVEMGGNPNPSDLAGALGIKLVCTFLGLVIAIPSLSVYGIMRNKIDAIAVETVNLSQSLIAPFRAQK
jgi:biopolymer transport protein ExbB